MDKTYDALKLEKKWQAYWTKNKLYTFNPKSKQSSYTIDTPPPTLSGDMHIGHAFSYAQGDYIARYQRMAGKNVLYPFGTDDNGLATEKLVERLKKVNSRNMSRKEFVQLCIKTIQDIKADFVQPWKDLGISCDFTSSYSTIDDHSRKTSQLSFIKLYEQGRVYSEDAPVAWCTECQTAIAQAEFVNKELTSSFNDIVFKEGGNELVIATTRPEMLPACVGVFYHPDDKRYKHLKGKFATVPLFDYEVPFLEDDQVDPEKGTGIMMCCTYGDKLDIEWWHKYNLQTRTLFNKDGTLNELAGKYKGMDIKKARKQILQDLAEAHLLKEKKQITHPVNLHERCHTEIEFIKTKQWYIKVLDKKQELVNAADKITWHPEFMKKRYVHWVENLQWDWCISRQRHFGVAFPLWKCDTCDAVLLAEEKQLPLDPLVVAPKKKKCDCGGTYKGEQDVMDTWTTSSLTPQIVLDWADDKHFDKSFPMGLRMQAHDIIRTWAFYTIVKGVFTHHKAPWENIMISGFVTIQGEKMSKSKGNVVDPLVIMKEHGADALRFWAASGKLGQDLNYMEKDVLTGRKMTTKLWNASKFVLSHLEDFKNKQPKKLSVIDAYMLSKLQQVIEKCRTAFDNYEYHDVKTTVEHFFWHDFCDNYLETIKDRLYNPDKRGKEARHSAQYGVHHMLLVILKLLAPIMPHITEEIYSHHFNKDENKPSIHVSDYPNQDKKLVNTKIEEVGEAFFSLVADVRKEKTAQGKSLGAEITLTIDKKTKTLLKDCLDDLQAVCKATKIKEGKFSVSF